MPHRKKSFILVAHCHLNGNTKVHGLCDYAGARSECIIPEIQKGTGIIQLPCPEALFMGMSRWSMTREQYDIASFRSSCRKILEPIVMTSKELIDDGCVLERIVGVAGSPNCALLNSCAGYTGGLIDEEALNQKEVVFEGPGIFMEELIALLKQHNISVAFDEVSERISSEK